jgi:hypothetical protein
MVDERWTNIESMMDESWILNQVWMNDSSNMNECCIKMMNEWWMDDG